MDFQILENTIKLKPIFNHKFLLKCRFGLPFQSQLKEFPPTRIRLIANKLILLFSVYYFGCIHSNINSKAKELQTRLPCAFRKQGIKIVNKKHSGATKKYYLLAILLSALFLLFCIFVVYEKQF